MNQTSNHEGAGICADKHNARFEMINSKNVDHFYTNMLWQELAEKVECMLANISTAANGKLVI